MASETAEAREQRSGALAGSVALSGLIALCTELVASDRLEVEAANRVREAMLRDLQQSRAPLRTVQTLAMAIQDEFDARLAPAAANRPSED